MELAQRLSVVTIGAEDLGRMKDFYIHVFGWQPLAANADIVFFKLNGFLLSLCKCKPLADFIGIEHCGLGFRRTTFGYNVPTKDAVDEWYDHLLKKEVNMLKPPTMALFGAYFFYFTDIEGNIWEIAYNPYTPLEDNGNVLTHESIDHLG